MLDPDKAPSQARPSETAPVDGHATRPGLAYAATLSDDQRRRACELRDATRADRIGPAVVAELRERELATLLGPSACADAAGPRKPLTIIGIDDRGRKVRVTLEEID